MVLAAVLPMLPLLRLLSCSSKFLELSTPQRLIIVQSPEEHPCTRSFPFFSPHLMLNIHPLPPEVTKELLMFSGVIPFLSMINQSHAVLFSLSF